jgi:hypothetical protein
VLFYAVHAQCVLFDVMLNCAILKEIELERRFKGAYESR